MYTYLYERIVEEFRPQNDSAADNELLDSLGQNQIEV